MAKLPYIQFYPGDWRKDPGVQSLDYETRGIWFEILMLMFESSERGKLLLNGQPMPDEAIARYLGLDKQKATTHLTNLLTYGVASRDEKDGALVCRRMIRDEELRSIRSECGKLGGNPKLKKDLLNQNPNQISDIDSEDEKGKGGAGGKQNDLKIQFDAARQAYPGTRRGLETEWKHFQARHGKRAAEIVPLLMPAILAFRAHIQREKTERKFIKHFQGWITEERWTVEYAAPVIKPSFEERARNYHSDPRSPHI